VVVTEKFDADAQSLNRRSGGDWQLGDLTNNGSNYSLLEPNAEIIEARRVIKTLRQERAIQEASHKQEVDATRPSTESMQP
jgi:hypothetical protein